MIQTEREKPKKPKQPTTEEEIKDLKDSLEQKEVIIQGLQGQIDTVQIALDEIIFGGMI